MKHILVATDGSEGADRAVNEAAVLATRFGADLLIVNVIGGYGLPGEVLERFTRPEHAWFNELLTGFSAQILAKARDRAHQLGVSNVRLESREGDVAPAIVDIARQQGIDAIVVGRRGHGRVAEILLGSTAEKLVKLAPCLVTVVP